MKAIDCPFMKIINGTSQFVIPVFQRDYKWTDAQCEQLWKDVIAIAAARGDRGHFLGSVPSTRSITVAAVAAPAPAIMAAHDTAILISSSLDTSLCDLTGTSPR
jgi:Protein of unknown function DUF262